MVDSQPTINLQEQPSFWKLHPVMALMGILVVLGILYIIFVQDYPPEHAISQLRNSIGNSILVIIAITVTLVIAYFVNKNINKRRIFHPVPKIKQNVIRYSYEEYGELVNPIMMQVDELIPGGNEYTVYNPSTIRIIRYDPNFPSPHIKADLIGDIFTYKKQLLKERHFEAFAKQQQEEGRRVILQS